ncbi:MAG: ABC transporter permease [Acidimicrobiia bacterium]|nr:ABC transporter permease [Acidimicrobiia bacterium]
MQFLGDVLGDAIRYVFEFGPELRSILGLTLVVAGVATAIGVLVGVPFGVWLGLSRFRGRGLVLALVNTGMGIPPVLAGLLLLILLWNDGVLGSWDALFTPGAMIGAQALLAFPIAAGVTAGAVRNLSGDAVEQLDALKVSGSQRTWIAAREVWPGIAAAVAAAFGRVIAEVGAVLIVGGNIAGETRVLTTAIVQEARQSNLGAALGLGIVLLLVALLVNLALTWAQLRGEAAPS